MAWRCVALTAWALALAPACSVRVDYSGTEFQCDPTGACPSGFECRAGTCVPEGSATEDAGIDAAPTPDASTPLVCASTNKLVDDFEDGVIGPLWGGFADTGTAYLEQDGQLVLRVNAGAGDAWVGYYSRYPHDLSGSHAQVRVDQVGPLYTVLEVKRPDGARAQLLQNGLEVKAAVYGLPTGDGVRAAQPYTPEIQRWWRIREQGGVMHWEVSGDGATWTTLHQEPNPFPPRMLQVLLAAGGSVELDAEARFDELNPDGDPDVPWCSLSTLSDDFDDGQRADEWGHSWQNTGCVLAELEGTAAIQFDGTASSWCGYETWPRYEGCNGQAAIEIPAPLDVANAEMWLNIYLPDGRLSIEQWEGTLRLTERAGDEVTMSSTLPYDTAAHRWWRLRTDGASTHWETAPDGVTWTTHTSRALTLDCGTAFVGFGAGLMDTWTAGAIEARFDRFNVSP